MVGRERERERWREGGRREVFNLSQRKEMISGDSVTAAGAAKPQAESKMRFGGGEEETGQH